MKLKLDLHVHTSYSSDSVITLKDLVFYAKRHGLDGVAITDHDRIDGALRMIKETDFLIIPGVEISTSNGHIVGLNVSELIPPKLSVGETLDRIHEAAGLAVACHPMTFFKESLKDNISPQFDAIEVINASTFPFGYSTRRNFKIASHLGISCVAGSDAHYGPEIGYAYTTVDAEPEIGDIIEEIKSGLCSPHGIAIPLAMRLKRQLLLLKNKF